MNQPSCPSSAARIVSLLPSATEWVCELGLGEQLVGISHECDFPAQVNALPRVTRSRIDPEQSSQAIDAAVGQHSQTQTSLYELDAERLAQLKPDLILTQTLCNVCAVNQADVHRSMAAIGRPSTLLDLHGQTLSEVFEDAERVLRAAGGGCSGQRATCSGRQAMQQLQKRVESVEAATRQALHKPTPKVVLLEWVQPLYCAGHWTPEIIGKAGGHDPIGEPGKPSRVIEPAELIRANPDLLLVACCGMDSARTAQELDSLGQIEG
ncbi:MAG: cobalamin-binding protein, partial [Pirellulales bacterium]|nr:cobalamin-binding protein [Pirellulales bacterium]